MMKIRSLLTLLYLIPAVSVAQKFIASFGSLCINSTFVETVSNAASSDSGEIFCATVCAQRNNCQAFTITGSYCTLFVFDRCNKYVRSSCNCTRRGQLFIKQQAGLDEGALCPSGYVEELCGVKYKMIQINAGWQQHLANSKQESGLVFMADIVDSNEMAFMRSLTVTYSAPFYVGGHQIAGSAEPAGGWFWVACNFPVNSTFWETGEPNDNPHDENAVIVSPNLMDYAEALSYYGLFECVSPFN